MADCTSYEPLLHLVLDGEATPEERQTVMDHLAVCGACREKFQQLTELHMAFTQLDTEVPAGLTGAVMDRIRAEGQAAKKKSRRSSFQLKGLAALAACCAIAFLGLQMLPNQSNSSGSMTDGGAPESAFYAANAQMADSDDAADSGDGADSSLKSGKGMLTESVDAARDIQPEEGGDDNTSVPQEDLGEPVEVETDEAAVGRWLAENRPGEESPVTLTPEETVDLARWVLEEAGIDLGLPMDRPVLLTSLGPEA